MRGHRSLGGLRITPEQSLDDRRVFAAIVPPTAFAEGALLDLEPLLLIADELEDRVQAGQQLVARRDEDQLVKRRVALLEQLDPSAAKTVS